MISFPVVLFDVVKFKNDPCTGDDPFGRVSFTTYYKYLINTPFPFFLSIESKNFTLILAKNSM